MPHCLFNIYINILNDKDFIKNFFSDSVKPIPVTFYYLNTYSLYLYDKDPVFRKAFAQADYILPDGASIKFASKFLKKKEIDKVTFTHLFFNSLEKLVIQFNIPLFLLGSRKEVIERASGILSDKGINIKGFHNGFFKMNQNESIIEEINNSKADFLLVGMGSPKSEKWVHENINKLKVSKIITVGNFFDVISGKVKLAPVFLYNTGFEWVFRLLQEPGRLFKRYITAHSYFIKKCLLEYFNE